MHSIRSYCIVICIILILSLIMGCGMKDGSVSNTTPYPTTPPPIVLTNAENGHYTALFATTPIPIPAISPTVSPAVSNASPSATPAVATKKKTKLYPSTSSCEYANTSDYCDNGKYIFYYWDRKIIRTNIDHSERMLLFYKEDIRVSDMLYYRGWLYYICNSFRGSGDSICRMKPDGLQNEIIYGNITSLYISNYCIVGDYLYFTIDPDVYIYADYYDNKRKSSKEPIQAGIYRIDISNPKDKGELLHAGSYRFEYCSDEYIYLSKYSNNNIYRLSVDTNELALFFNVEYKDQYLWDFKYYEDEWIYYRLSSNGAYRLSEDRTILEQIDDHTYPKMNPKSYLSSIMTYDTIYTSHWQDIYTIDVETGERGKLPHDPEFEKRNVDGYSEFTSMRINDNTLCINEIVYGEKYGQYGIIERTLWSYDLINDHWTALERDSFEPRWVINYDDEIEKYYTYTMWTQVNQEVYTQ